MINFTKLYPIYLSSTDALWEKYPGWSPYQYSLNNPINMLDWNGKELINSNLTPEQMKNFNSAIQFLGSLKSPTINNIISLAQGDKSTIYLNTLNRPAETSSKTHAGGTKTIEDYWNKRESIGMTLETTKMNDMIADVVILTENLNETDFNPFAVVVPILDELNHTIMDNGTDEKDEHSELYKKIKTELESGLFDENGTNKFFIQNHLLPLIEAQMKKDEKQ